MDERYLCLIVLSCEINQTYILFADWTRLLKDCETCVFDWKYSRGFKIVYEKIIEKKDQWIHLIWKLYLFEQNIICVV